MTKQMVVTVSGRCLRACACMAERMNQCRAESMLRLHGPVSSPCICRGTSGMATAKLALNVRLRLTLRQPRPGWLTTPLDRRSSQCKAKGCPSAILLLSSLL